MLKPLRVNKRGSGFTIIEVLIVLAIAGLIMLIVFLAVPALQRNAHNTSAKNDVSAILAGMSEYTNNNSGALPPTQGAGSVGATTYTVGAGSTGASTAVVKLGYYTADQVKIVSSLPGSTQAAPTSGVIVYEKATCTGNVAVPGGSRSYVALYAIEGSTTGQCTAS